MANSQSKQQGLTGSKDFAPRTPPLKTRQEPGPIDREVCNSPTWEAWTHGRGRSFSWLRRRSLDAGPHDGVTPPRVAERRPSKKLKKKPPAAMDTQKIPSSMLSFRGSQANHSVHSSSTFKSVPTPNSVAETKGSFVRSLSLKARKKKTAVWWDEGLNENGLAEQPPLSKANVSERNPQRHTGAPKQAVSRQARSPTKQSSQSEAVERKEDASLPRVNIKQHPPSQANGIASTDTPSTRNNEGSHHEQIARQRHSSVVAKHEPVVTNGQAATPLQSEPLTFNAASVGIQKLRPGPGLRRSSEVRSRHGSRGANGSANNEPSPDHGVSSLELTDKTFLECCRCRRFFEAPPEFGLAIECECRSVREVRKVAKERGIEFREGNIKWHFAIRSDGRLRLYCFWCHHAMRRSCCEAWRTSLGKMDRTWHPLG